MQASLSPLLFAGCISLVIWGCADGSRLNNGPTASPPSEPTFPPEIIQQDTSLTASQKRVEHCYQVHADFSVAGIYLLDTPSVKRVVPASLLHPPIQDAEKTGSAFEYLFVTNRTGNELLTLYHYGGSYRYEFSAFRLSWIRETRDTFGVMIPLPADHLVTEKGYHLGMSLGEFWSVTDSACMQVYTENNGLIYAYNHENEAWKAFRGIQDIENSMELYFCKYYFNRKSYKLDMIWWGRYYP